jgi:hypothetical protein
MNGAGLHEWVIPQQDMKAILANASWAYARRPRQRKPLWSRVGIPSLNSRPLGCLNFCEDVRTQELGQDMLCLSAKMDILQSHANLAAQLMAIFYIDSPAVASQAFAHIDPWSNGKVFERQVLFHAALLLDTFSAS